MVWCLRDKLGDTELHLPDVEDRRHRFRHPTSAAGYKQRSTTSGLGGSASHHRCQSRLSKSVDYNRSSTTDNDDNDGYSNYRNNVCDAEPEEESYPDEFAAASKSADSGSWSPHIPLLSSRSPVRASTLNSTSAGGQPRLVRQLAVQERSPRASFGSDASAPEGRDRSAMTVVEMELGAARAAARNLRLKPPRRRRDGNQSSADGGFMGLGSLGSVSTGHQLTVNEACYSAGSSFESSGSAG